MTDFKPNEQLYARWRTRTGVIKSEVVTYEGQEFNGKIIVKRSNGRYKLLTIKRIFKSVEDISKLIIRDS